MDPLTIGSLALVALFVLLLLTVPIGVSMGLCGLVGISLIIGWDAAFALFGTTVFETIATYDLSIIPLFVLMGAIASRSGLSGELYLAFHSWFGARQGGLALSTIAACGAFSAICGSSVATAATMTRVAVPEMKRFNYADSLATGSVAAGGIIGILIPPSVVMVLYGVLTQTSIGDLFIAGLLPGLLTIVGFMIVVSIITRISPELGPAGTKTTLQEKLTAMGRTWPILLLFTLIIGGIYLGVFTPTEASGVGAVGAFVIAAARGRLTRPRFVAALRETLTTTAMIFVVLIGAVTLNNLIIFSGIASGLSDFVTELALPSMATMVVLLLIYLVLGCFLDALAMMLLTVPIFFPIVSSLGFDPVWFGIIIVMVVELGLITPPIGMNIFVIKGMVPQVPLSEIYRGVIPFVIAQILLIIVVFLLPDLVLWLPETARALR